VTSDDLIIEENPAYQTVTAQPYVYVVDVTSRTIAMEENPAYQSVDTTKCQT